MIRILISILIATAQYFLSSLYKASHFISMILTLACIGIWISIATHNTFELDQSGTEQDLFFRVNSVVTKLILYRYLSSINVL